MIRRAVPEDAPLLARLLDAFNSEYEESTPPVEELSRHYAELLGTGELTVLLSEEAGTALGFSQLRLKRSVYTGKPDGLIEELYVVPDRRGEGLGRALLEATLAAAREAGATHIELNTGETDEAARALYESSGFTNLEGGPDGPRMLYYEREL